MLKNDIPVKREMNYTFEKYITTKEKLRDTLNEFGVAIIPNVINNEEIQSMINGMWDYLEHITQKLDNKIKRNDESTWKHIHSLYPLHSMLLKYWGIGHAQFMWNLRQNEKIIDIMSYFWNVQSEDLLVSFDGSSIHMPPEITGTGWYSSEAQGWLHTDQSYTRNKFECVQSWVTAFDVDDGDATLAVLEGSHKYHKEFRDTFYTNGDQPSLMDWYRLNLKELNFYKNKGCEKVCIKCPAGSMVYWDSRTIHCGQEAMIGRPTPKMRCVSYLCYMPRNTSTPLNLKRKQQAFNELVTTNHWANKPVFNEDVPRNYKNNLKKITKIRKPNITPLGKKLAGF